MKTTGIPCLIAEACQNHNGDLAILRDMIWAAKEAGADYIKIQSMRADDLTRRERFEEGIVVEGTIRAIKRPYRPEYERLKPLDLDDQAHHWFIEECRKAGIRPLTTVFTLSRIPFLSSLSWEEIKVPSYDCASLPLIKELKNNFRRLYISTGATFDGEIRDTAETLKGHSFTFLHCVTIYPTPLEEIHLRRIDWLRQFTDSVGFSDHTLVEKHGIKASCAALYYGADVVERHFTILKRDQTKDGPVSVMPAELKALVEFARADKRDQKAFIEKHIEEFGLMLGRETRALSPQELLNRDYYRGRFASRIGGRTRYNWEEEE
jgi:sialic acid synthase SpsE